jgi:hypothetical protein
VTSLPEEKTLTLFLIEDQAIQPFSPAIGWVIISIMLQKLTFYLVTLMIVLSACSSGEQGLPADSHDAPSAEIVLPADTPLPAAPTAPEATAVPSPQPTPTEEVPPPNTSYKMDITFDYAARRANVEQVITYANHTGVPLNDLVIKVEPMNYPGVFDLQNFGWADGSTINNPQWDGAVVTIPLDEVLKPGQVRSIAIAYNLSMPRMIEDEYLRPPIFGYTDRQINIVDWYPFLPPYTDTGWMVHPRGHYGEHLTYDTADFEVNLRLLNAPNNVVVAASGEQQSDGDWRRYRLPNGRNFVFSLSPDYQVLEGSAGDVKVYSYSFPLYATASDAVLQTTINSLFLFQELFVPYPHSTLSAVQADFLDGMEYEGLYFLSRAFYNTYSGKPSEYLIAIASHETAHMWWYALIGNNQAIEPWLDEALCTYMEHIYYEHYAPEALDWWWTYRVNYYEPRGLIDVSIYDKHGHFQSYRDYRDAVYLNGAVFLHELRGMIGDETFFAFLKDYAARHAGGIATRGSFFAVLGEHTTVDISGLMARYFRD